MLDLISNFFKLPWLRKPVSLLLILIGTYFLFDFLKSASWTFFLFLNQESFSKYMLDYQGPFKLLQQLKNDQMMYFSLSECLEYVLPVMVIFGVGFWINHFLKRSNNRVVTKFRDFLIKEFSPLIWINFFIIAVFIFNFINFSRLQYINSVNEFIQFKVWMAENNRKVEAGCVYYPKRAETFYFDIDFIDFTSHFTGYSLSPLKESLKDVLSITSETKVDFEDSLCDANRVDPNKDYSGSEVKKMLEEYSDSCGKRNIIKDLKLKISNAPVRVESKGYRTLVTVNYKPFAFAEFKCSKDSRELMQFKFTKILNGE